jgi:hypothetical protein
MSVMIRRATHLTIQAQHHQRATPTTLADFVSSHAEPLPLPLSIPTSVPSVPPYCPISDSQRPDGLVPASQVHLPHYFTYFLLRYHLHPSPHIKPAQTFSSEGACFASLLAICPQPMASTVLNTINTIRFTRSTWSVTHRP